METITIPYVARGHAGSPIVHITEKTETRVRGTIEYVALDVRCFDVKHDGHSFAIGSGSGKLRFYFANAAAPVEVKGYTND